MKPRASAPRTRSGCFCLTQSASSPIVCLSAAGSASSGVMSLNPTPGVGKSATSRIFVRRSSALTPTLAGRARRAARELLRELGRADCRSRSPCCAALGVAGAERRRDELLEQRRLAVGGRPERAQVPRVDAVARELRADRGDVGVGLRVALVRPRCRAVPSRPKSSSSFASSRVDARRARRARRASIVSSSVAERRRACGACAPSRPARRARRGSRAAAGTRRAAAAGSSAAARGRPR